MEYRHCFPVLVLLLACGCSTPAVQETAPPTTAVAITLDELVIPEKLDSLELLAQSASDNQRNVIYRSSLDNLPSLQVSIYPLPDGWELWDVERQLLGHYGQVRLAVLNQLATKGDNFSHIRAEQEPDFTQKIPVAALQARSALANSVLTENHLLALYQGYYFKARYDAEANDSPLALEEAQLLLRHLIEQLLPKP